MLRREATSFEITLGSGYDVLLLSDHSTAAILGSHIIGLLHGVLGIDPCLRHGHIFAGYEGGTIDTLRGVCGGHLRLLLRVISLWVIIMILW